MQVNYWGEQDWINNEVIMEVIDQNESIFLSSVFKEETAVLNSVEIETINRCNNDCSFCPVNRNNDVREKHIMEEGLFKKIINELSQMNYTGFISLYSNNEPLLDKRIFDFIEYAKEKLPNAIHALYTNGMLLNIEKYNRLVSSLDYLIIDNYNDELILNKNIQDIKEKEVIRSHCCKVKVDVRRKNQILTNRGGIAPNKKNFQRFSSPCVLPFFQMVIRPDGKVSRCCQDAYGNSTLGNLKKESVQEIFLNDKYKAYREFMINKKRPVLEYCNVCELLGLHNYYPTRWKKEYVINFLEYVVNKQKTMDIVLHSDCNQALFHILKANGIQFNRVLDDVVELKKSEFLILTSYNENILHCLLNQHKKVGDDFIVYNEDYFQVSFIQKHNYVVARKKLNVAEKVVIFGTGDLCKRLLDAYQCNIDFFIDNNQEKQGTEYCGKRIYGIEWLSDMDCDTLVIIAVFALEGYLQIYRQLIKIGIKDSQIVWGAELI